MGVNDGYTEVPGHDIESGHVAQPPPGYHPPSSSTSNSMPPQPASPSPNPDAHPYSAKYPQSQYAAPMYIPASHPANVPTFIPQDTESTPLIPHSIHPHLDPSANPAIIAERQLRHGFLRKVLGIVSLQLILTIAIAIAIATSPPIRAAISTPIAIYSVIAASLITLIPLMCCESVRHSYPANLLLLFAFTIAEALLVGLVTCQFDTHAVIAAVGITAFITVCLTLFALQNKVDLTTSGSVLFGVLAALLVCPLLGSLLHLSISETFYSAIGAVLFSVYIVYDVQLVAGEGRLAMSPDDHIPAAINIYLDIINLFLRILQLLASDRN